jgi:hypothetical protein
MCSMHARPCTLTGKEATALCMDFCKGFMKCNTSITDQIATMRTNEVSAQNMSDEVSKHDLCSFKFCASWFHSNPNASNLMMRFRPHLDIQTYSLTWNHTRLTMCLHVRNLWIYLHSEPVLLLGCHLISTQKKNASMELSSKVSVKCCLCCSVTCSLVLSEWSCSILVLCLPHVFCVHNGFHRSEAIHVLPFSPMLFMHTRRILQRRRVAVSVQLCYRHIHTVVYCFRDCATTGL